MTNSSNRIPVIWSRQGIRYTCRVGSESYQLANRWRASGRFEPLDDNFTILGMCRVERVEDTAINCGIDLYVSTKSIEHCTKREAFKVMPNGGSDNCGTCWFNRKNIGGNQRGRRSYTSTSPHCEIRDVSIKDPFYTYCANHPHRRSVRDPVPIGPILVGQVRSEFAYERVMWKPSPDTEDVRQHLLDLLDDFERTSIDDLYLAFPSVIHTVVWQLGEFGEKRAVKALQRLGDNLQGESANFVREALKSIGSFDA